MGTELAGGAVASAFPEELDSPAAAVVDIRAAVVDIRAVVVDIRAVVVTLAEVVVADIRAATILETIRAGGLSP